MEISLKEPIAGYKFKVMSDELTASFSKVSNIEREYEYEEYQEGGTNDRVLLFRKPKSKPDILRLERGVCSNEIVNMEPGMRFHNITIMIMRNSIPVKIFSIEEGVVKSVSISDLNALSGEIIIETLELFHTGLEPVKIK